MRIELIKEYYGSEEYLDKVRDRMRNLQEMAEDPFSRARRIMDVYAVDFERFCEDFLFLIIPEFGDAIKPFFLFEYQKKVIRKIQEAEMSGRDYEILVDKPRGMGLTWIFCAYMYWRWLFTPNWSALVLSRKQEEVDDGTASPGNSIFSKIRWMMARTPEWILPQGFEPKGKKGNSTDSSLRLTNPVMGSTLAGSSTNSNAGRGRRYSFIFIDECFAIEGFTEVHRALQSVSRVQVYVSTTKASMEAKRFKDVVEEAGNYVSLEWRDHPWKDEVWYQEKLKAAEFDPEMMKEVDKGYSVSEKMQYYPEVKEARIVKMGYNPNLPLYCGLDFGKGDLTVIIWAQFDGDQINIVECYANKGKGKADWYAPFLNPHEDPNTRKERRYQYTALAEQMIEKVGKWEKPIGYFGELAHTIKSMADGKSIASELARCGIRLIYNSFAVEFEPRRKATSLLLPKMVFNEDSEGVRHLYDAIANSRYKNSESSKRTSMEPVHDDEIADYRAALENLCVNVPRILKHQRKDIGENMKSGNLVHNLISFLKV